MIVNVHLSETKSPLQALNQLDICDETLASLVNPKSVLDDDGRYGLSVLMKLLSSVRAATAEAIEADRKERQENPEPTDRHVYTVGGDTVTETLIPAGAVRGDKESPASFYRRVGIVTGTFKSQKTA